MSIVQVRVPGKVNLALCVGETDAQGYHELGTVFQAVSLCDDITVSRLPQGEFRLSVTGEGSAFLPIDDTNLALRAAKLLANRYQVTDAGVAITIRKRIPVAGGMAGGSADAAGTLLACSALWAVNASREELRDLAAELGSDVPFLLLGGTAIGTGRGEKLSPVPASGVYHWVFAMAHGGLSTPAVFREFDRTTAAQPTTLPEGLISALVAGDVVDVGSRLVNHLQSAAIRLQPALQRTLILGQRLGALGAIISGSGPTAAFLFDDEEEANRVARELTVFSGVRSVRVVQGPVAGAQIVA